MCQCPMLAVNDYMNDNGTKHIKFLVSPQWNIEKAVSRFGKKNVYLIPCGKCDECSLAYRASWSIRCLAELPYCDAACFVTLTYDDRHLPFDNKLRKKDLQNFWKRLRKVFPNKTIRYFCCGEYGSQTNRPHYHAVIFGYEPTDLKTFSKNGNGNVFYSSDELDSIWQNGHTLIGEVAEDTIKYVAGYTGKKLGQDGFLLMSRKPGIGYQYVIDHAEEIVKSGSLVLKNGIVPAPRYALDICQALGYDVQKLKDSRLDLVDSKCRAWLIENRLTIKDMYYSRNKLTKYHKRKRGM